jgi:hypothetical protein
VTDPGNSPNDLPGDKKEIAARKRVGPPARLLLFLSVLNLLGSIYFMAYSIIIKKEGPPASFQDQWDKEQKNPESRPFLADWTAGEFATAAANAMLGYFGIAGLVSVATLAGARRMVELRSYRLAVASTILMASPCLTPCCIFGQIVGVWGFVMLMQPDVRRAFQ